MPISSSFAGMVWSLLSSSRLLARQAKLVDHLLADEEFLNLARHGHRELIDEADVTRDLVVRDLASAKRANFFFVGLLLRLKSNPGAEFLAVLLVGHANDLHVGDFRMAVEKFLDLAWIEILAAADDHILDPSDDVAIAIGV